MPARTLDMQVPEARPISKSKSKEIPAAAKRKISWGWGVLAALAMALLSLFPQIDLWHMRDADWQGGIAFHAYDEGIYAAYVNGLILGRSRRIDPLASYEAGKPQPESLFSIQFVPAYLIALPARALGLTAAQAFIILTPLVAFFSTLLIFYLLALVLGDEALASVGALCVLIFGTLVARDGVVLKWMGDPTFFGFFPFLRRYQPGAAFPLF